MNRACDHNWNFMRQFLNRIDVYRLNHPRVVIALTTTIIILLATVIQRLMVVGGLPTTDEGIYAYQAQLIHSSLTAGKGLPDAGTLNLYPMLLSWVFEITSNSLIIFRLMDLLVAITASWLLESAEFFLVFPCVMSTTAALRTRAPA